MSLPIIFPSYAQYIKALQPFPLCQKNPAVYLVKLYEEYSLSM